MQNIFRSRQIGRISLRRFFCKKVKNMYWFLHYIEGKEYCNYQSVQYNTTSMQKISWGALAGNFQIICVLIFMPVWNHDFFASFGLRPVFMWFLLICARHTGPPSWDTKQNQRRWHGIAITPSSLIQHHEENKVSAFKKTRRSLQDFVW